MNEKQTMRCKKGFNTKMIVAVVTILLTIFALSAVALAATTPSMSKLTISNIDGSDSRTVSVSAAMSYNVPTSWTGVLINATSDAEDITVSNADYAGNIGNAKVFSSTKLNFGDNTFNIALTNGTGDDIAKKDYTLNIKRPLNLSLKKITISGSETQVFDNPTSPTNLTVPYSDSKVTLSAVAADNNVKITYDGNKDSSYEVPLSVGLNSVTIKVESDSSSETFNSQSYVVNITRLDTGVSTNADLSGVDITINGSTSPIGNFSRSKTEYDVTTSSTTSSVRISPKTYESGSTVKIIDGSYSYNGSATVEAPSNSTGRAIKIEVTAPDRTTKKVYTINLKLDPNAASDATLKSLSAKSYGFTSNFYSTTYSYNLKVPNNVTSVSISASANSNTSQIYITDSTYNPLTANTSYASSSTANITFASNIYSKTAYVYVRSSGGNTQKYTVSITRNSSTSDNYDLRNLSVQYSSTTANLLPSFNAGTTKYYVCIPKNSSSVYITPTASDSNATITVDGNTVSSGSKSSSISVPTGSSGKTITVRVTSPSGSDYQNYSIYVYRAPYTSQTDCDADNIYVRAGKSSGSSSQSTFTATPTFASGTTSYKVYLDDDYRYLSFKVNASDDDSRIFAMYDNTAYQLDDGSYSSTIKISDSTGTNGAKVTIRVYSADYTKYKDYVYTIYNSGSKNSDCYLSSMVVKADGSTKYISPSFSKTTKNYTLNVDTNTDYVTITPTTVDSYSTVTVNGKSTDSGSQSVKIYLSSNTTVIPIVVEAGNGDKYTYGLTVTKGKTANKKIVLRLDSKTYLNNNISRQLLAAPYMTKDRTMVPLRMISEEFGATVAWNEKTKTITIKKDNKTLTLTIGKTSAALDVAPAIKNNTTFVPVRYVTEQLGANVEWIGSSKEIVITD